MFSSIQNKAKTAATIGLASALAVGGVAVAQGGGSGNGNGNAGAKHRAHRMHPPGPPGGLPMRNLTYGELHVQKQGEAAVIRLDNGKVVSTGADSITLRENDGNEVTIPVDDSTRVLAGPGKRGASVADLKEGTQVLVHREQGGKAKAVIVAPPRPGKDRKGHPPNMRRGQGGNRPQGMRGGRLPPPPPPMRG
jgi:hypothetical protein